eukprot:CAMPEP_0184416142 /NCGR_PEP_ID=MMETSP0738-20130409/9265_1 /TAXON_ID=385413 /ORGANISM="Thalassiosira miniscula, Strain CCMP1093" /LENGTH=32 /DNA_ID= /DNA_START= /DNA_END= /DNA_ORIENTATION=
MNRRIFQMVDHLLMKVVGICDGAYWRNGLNQV